MHRVDAGALSADPCVQGSPVDWRFALPREKTNLTRWRHEEDESLGEEFVHGALGDRIGDVHPHAAPAGLAEVARARSNCAADGLTSRAASAAVAGYTAGAGSSRQEA
ncbi:MAG: hypothetical protein U0163_17905 [Gemmatimonadaceae bacterium]